MSVLTAAATFLVATPAHAYANTTYASIWCYDPPWPLQNSVDYEGHGADYRPNYRLHVIRQVLKNNIFLHETHTYPWTNGNGSWGTQLDGLDVGSSGSSGTYKVIVWVNDYYDQVNLGIRSATCTI